MIKRLYHILIIIFVCMYQLAIYAQSDKPIKKSKSYLYLDYKQSGNNKHLVVTLKAKVNKKFVLLDNAEVNFMAYNDDEELKLGSATTNKEGIAKLALSGTTQLPVNEDGLWQFSAKYKGSAEYSSKSDKLKIMQANFAVELLSDDNSTKKIVIKGAEVGTDSLVPISETDAEIKVGRMFSLLDIGETELLDGQAFFEFPDDIPGNRTGHITVHTIISDKKYGTFENIQDIDWGIPLQNKESKNNTAGLKYALFILLSSIIFVSILIIGRRYSKQFV